MMSFSYNYYMYNLFIVPFVSGIMVISFSIYYCSCCLFEKDKMRGNLKFIGMIVIAVWILSSSILVKLKNGGIYFITEKETDSIVEEGVIENVFNPSERLHGFKSSYGADIEIDGNLYFIESVEGLNVGDRIEFKYLPKSTCILEIRKTE